MSHFPPRGFTSTNNSSTATLTGGAVFTGTSDDVSQYTSISITSNSDVASADSGLSMEFSPDGTNWDRQLPGHIAGQKKHTHTLRVINKFFRIVYTNGTAAQANFRLQVLYHTNNSYPTISRTGQAQNTIDAVPIRQTTEIDLDFARLHVSGGKSDFFFGQNNTLVNGTFNDVYAALGNINWQTTAAKIKIKSTHAADTATGPGLGLQSVEIHGLDSTGAAISEVLDLAGTTPVESALSYLRVSLVHNQEVGTYGGSHQGTIEWRVTNATFGNGALLGKMTGLEGAADSSVQFGYGEAQNGFTTVPLGKVLYITQIEVIPNSAKPINVALYEREGITTVADPFLPRRVIWSVDQLVDPVEKEFKTHIKIKALTDLWFRAEGSSGASGVSVWLNYYLVDEDASGA